MATKRLLILTERFPPDVGGVASSAERIARGICRLGVAVDVLHWARSLPPGEVEITEEGDLRVVQMGMYRQWDLTLPMTEHWLSAVHGAHPYGAVWGHYLVPAGFMAVWLGETWGIPATVSARGNDVDRGMFPPHDFARLQWTLARSPQITAVSQDLGRKIERLSGRRDVLVLGNAVDTERFTPVGPTLTRAELGISEEALVLGFIGELREKKGEAYLLEAFAQVQRVRPAVLVIIGEVRESIDATLYHFRDRHPQAQLVVTGHLTDPEQVAAHIRLCDLVVLPSLWEGMPNALLEAMACGRCCLASDVGGIPELLRHGENGWLIGRSQLAQLGTAILEFANLPATLKQRVAERARQKMVQEYSLDQEGDRLKALCQAWYPVC
ncbi:MAG: glycosyltransferase family 4 protein [Oscillatoriales cyanobacterium SM2_2_1]|nr:glycosyltransferase family 4 protein [Oscillatoriales cyanobacterium SM2_2_1]